MSDEKAIKVRFAPSPTGYLHIGGARTCLFNWLYVRKLKGEFILRIEDTDKERSQKEYLDEILESIKWLGMDWDQVYYQSQRFSLYQEYAQMLLKEKKAYQKEGAIFFKYEFERIKINDLIRGEIVFNELPKDEEVIIKSDSSPTYNFSCVIDDALMGISCVIRGEDHIPNTPKQILMYKALKFNPPEFAHLPLILSAQGGRLSKRFGATSIREYKNDGYLAAALVNYLLLLGWSPGDDKEILSLKEAKEIFRIEDVNKTGAIFSLDKLNWINGEYLRRMDIQTFTDSVENYLIKNNCLDYKVERDYLEKICRLCQERIIKLSEFFNWAKFFFCDNINYSQDSQEILKRDLSPEIAALRDRLSASEDFSKEIIEKEFRAASEDLGLKLGDLIHPVRVALTGRKSGAGLFETMEVLGKGRVLKRLDRVIKFWNKEV